MFSRIAIETETNVRYPIYRRFYIDVTDRAKALFGDIVTKAEQVAYEQTAANIEKFDSIEEHIGAAKDEARRLFKEYEKEKDSLTANASNEVVITFTNNRIVRFRSSEWAYISAPLEQVGR